ncbi:LuxR C-terminal-related transcriptional regulator [Nakamurella sp.]|uniref:helix-turn-helix transcriptional regulator n=1 Tax=Nakamurella sp. TaxID=1869182 RepID=UPI003B3B5092
MEPGTMDPSSGWRSAADLAASALPRARSGEPTTLVITGESGMGKSTLLDEVARRAQGFTVVSAEGLDGDVDPYASLVGWGLSIDRADPRISSPFLIAQEIRSVLDAIGPDQPVLLRLDDLQWADPESVQALIALMRRMSGDRLLLMVATRPLGDLHPEWQRWVDRSDRVVRVSLQGLSLAEAQELAQRLQPGLQPSDVRMLWEHTGRNPLYLTALLSEYDRATLVGSRVAPAPEQFARITQQHLARLGIPATRMLRAVVVLGAGWVPLTDAAKVAGVADPEAAVDSLTAAGLAVIRDLAGGAEVRAAHALLRSAVYQQAPLPERREMHARAAKVVGPRDAVLDHRVAATTGYDDALAEELAGFGWSCYDQQRYRDAAKFLRQSAGLTSDVDRRERRWLDSLYLGAVAGDFVAVRTEFDRVRLARDAGRRALVLGATEILQGAPVLGVQILAADPDLLGGPPGDDRDRARVHYRLQALLAWARTTSGAATDLVLTGIQQCAELGVTDAAMTPMLRYASAIVALRVQGSEAMLATLPPLPDDPAAVPDDLAPLVGVRGMMRMFRGQFDLALRDQLVTQARIAAGREAEASPGGVHAFLGYLYWWTGRWDLARVHFRLAVQSARGEALPTVGAVVILDGAGRGEFAETDRLLGRLESRLSQTPWPEPIAQILEVAVVRLHAEAGAETARAELLPSYRARWPTSLDIGLQSVHGPLMAAPVLAAIWADDLKQAETWLQLVDAGPDAPAWAAAVADWLRALMAERRGDQRTALDFARRAADSGAQAVPFYRAHLLSDQARLELIAGERSRASRAAATALDIYRRLGAESYLDRPHLRLDESDPDGGRPSENGAEPVTVSLRVLGARFGLSDRELDVLTLLAGGLSMKQIAQELFITTSTVSFHLGRIYSKAGVHSRHQLTGILRAESMSA